jgi:hypothetical protein
VPDNLEVLCHMLRSYIKKGKGAREPKNKLNESLFDIGHNWYSNKMRQSGTPSIS